MLTTVLSDVKLISVSLFSVFGGNVSCAAFTQGFKDFDDKGGGFGRHISFSSILPSFSLCVYLSKWLGRSRGMKRMQHSTSVFSSAVNPKTQ